MGQDKKRAKIVKIPANFRRKKNDSFWAFKRDSLSFEPNFTSELDAGIEIRSEIPIRTAIDVAKSPKFPGPKILAAKTKNKIPRLEFIRPPKITIEKFLNIFFLLI